MTMTIQRYSTAQTRGHWRIDLNWKGELEQREEPLKSRIQMVFRLLIIRGLSPPGGLQALGRITRYVEWFSPNNVRQVEFIDKPF